MFETGRPALNYSCRPSRLCPDVHTSVGGLVPIAGKISLSHRLELGQMVSVLKCRGRTRYRYHIFKVPKVLSDDSLDGSCLTLFLDSSDFFSRI